MVKKKIKKKPKLTPEDKIKLKHIDEIRKIFERSGFKRAYTVADKEFTYHGTTSDFDDVFIYENILIFTEYTTTATSNLSGHLKKKVFLYNKILEETHEFIEFFDSKFASFKGFRNDIYSTHQCNVVILYCPLNEISDSLKAEIPQIKYFEYSTIEYFKSLTLAIKLSSRFELYNFFGIDFKRIGNNILGRSSVSKHVYEGSILPESFSNYSKGYKIVSFYIDPKSLLERSYVLRKDAWNDETGLYQRMIMSKKINSIRNYLNDSGRVFINNIIVTLAETTKILDKDENTVDPSKINETKAVGIQLPAGMNTIGLIDGQHRVYSYHEGGQFDDVISKLRVTQNLLVTGIIYPHNVSKLDKIRFESKLFLEINSNQANAASGLKQAIGVLINPFLADSIGISIISKLNNSGVLRDKFERNFYDKNKLKTASIVSFGLRPLVKLKGEDSLFKTWLNLEKEQLIQKDNTALLQEYIEFCHLELNIWFSAVQESVGHSRWTINKSVENRILNATIINGLLICFRNIILNGTLLDKDGYISKMKKIDSFPFKDYKSSQYSRLGIALFDKFFK
ncbi:MAG: hypothetical protein A3F91_02425 [Flavobacteria bacterium RIFCSPLOWO2_12_FULL_35_11]|nr:MAG: hypothetical protein A3F91_02425 [Flavobacteria bacterium RIFCSPLOWO2_12_FULL_35_11]